jgi:hypothetical protein
MPHPFNCASLAFTILSLIGDRRFKPSFLNGAIDPALRLSASSMPALIQRGMNPNVSELRNDHPSAHTRQLTIAAEQPYPPSQILNFNN